jgi:hypothetical protein
MFKLTDPRETINGGLAVLRRMNVSTSHKFTTHNKTVIVVTVLETSTVNIVYFGGKWGDLVQEILSYPIT